MNNNTDKIYAEITQRFVTQLEAGCIPWRKPWATSYLAPRNIVSGKAYRGINALMLGFSDFGSPYWATFKQISDLGGKVKKGSKASIVVYYTRIERKDAQGNVRHNENGEALTIPFLRYSNVFNLEQTEGIEAPADNTAIVPGDAALDGDLSKAEAIAAKTFVSVEQGGSSACYSPVLDAIRMPKIESFDSKAEYFHTLFHELGHATGHASRLNREGITGTVKFGSENYSKEELIAEITAAFVSNEAGILSQVTFVNSAAYVANWLSVLKGDHKLIVQAASGAQKAADFILGNN